MDLSFTPLARSRARDQRRGFALAPDFAMIVAGISARQAGSPTARAQSALGGAAAPTLASFNDTVATLIGLAARR